MGIKVFNKETISQQIAIKYLLGIRQGPIENKEQTDR